MDSAAAEQTLPQEEQGPSHILYVLKRLRNLKKRLEKIQQTETARKEGKVLNKDQLDAIATKESVLATIAELEKMKQVFDEDEAAAQKLAAKAAKKKAKEAVPAPAPAPVEPAAPIGGPETIVEIVTQDLSEEQMRRLVQLLHCLRVFENVDLRRRYLTRGADGVLSEGDFQVLDYLSKALTGASVPAAEVAFPDSVEMSLRHALHFVRASDEPLAMGVTYGAVAGKVEQFVQSGHHAELLQPAPVINFFTESKVVVEPAAAAAASPQSVSPLPAQPHHAAAAAQPPAPHAQWAPGQPGKPVWPAAPGGWAGSHWTPDMTKPWGWGAPQAAGWMPAAPPAPEAAKAWSAEQPAQPPAPQQAQQPPQQQQQPPAAAPAPAATQPAAAHRPRWGSVDEEEGPSADSAPEESPSAGAAAGSGEQNGWRGRGRPRRGNGERGGREGGRGNGRGGRPRGGAGGSRGGYRGGRGGSAEQPVRA